MTRTLEDRFWEKVSRDPDGCWLWTGGAGGPRTHRYGVIGIGSRTDGTRTTLRAHRLSYEIAFGPIPDGHDIHHKCEVTLCVRPDHLEAVTEREHVVERHDGPTAQNARKTHCPQGHPLEGGNLLVVKARSGTARRCRICRRDQSVRSDRKRRGLPASPFGRRSA